VTYEQVSEALARFRPEVIKVGDIREVDSSPWETWEPPEADEHDVWLDPMPADIVRRRWVLVVDTGPLEDGYVSVVLCGTPLDDWAWLTDRDLWVSKEDTGHWAHSIFCDLRGPVFTHQLGDLVGRLGTVNMALGKAASRGAADACRHRCCHVTGFPLRSRQDPRREYKQKQLKVLQRIIGPCTSWILEESAVQAP
jgi:hypothetical protein